MSEELLFVDYDYNFVGVYEMRQGFVDRMNQGDIHVWPFPSEPRKGMDTNCYTIDKLVFLPKSYDATESAKRYVKIQPYGPHAKERYHFMDLGYLIKYVNDCFREKEKVE